MSTDFTQYEYEALVERITELYSTKTGTGDGFTSSTGQMLIELLADTTDNLMFMLERRTQESYLSLARLESSVRVAASAVGYLPRRRVSASGSLHLELLDTDGNPTTAIGNINFNYGQPITFDGQDFIVAEDTALLPGDSSVDIPIIQGRAMSETYNFSIDPWFTDGYLVIPEYVDIEEFSLRVSTQDQEYFFVDELDEDGYRLGALSFADADTPAYDIKFAAEGMRILFGDGFFGMKPDSNVLVSWIESDGAEVNVTGTGLEFVFDNEFLYDDINVNPPNQYTYSMTNTTPISGGQDEEDMESMRQSITEYIRSNDRAVTNFDYAFRVRRSGIGDIVDVNVYGEHENDTIIFTMNNVYVAYINSTGTVMSMTDQQRLRDYLDRYKVNTTHIVLKPAVETPLRLTIEFKRHPQLPISDAQLYRDLRTAVYDYFEVEKGTIGKEFQHSEFVEYLQNLRIEFNGVSYAATDFVYVTAKAFFPFNVPTPAYDGIIELSTDYVPVRDEIWNVTVDGVTFSETVRQSDTVESLVLRMRQQLFSNTTLMIATPEPNQIRLKHPSETGTYTVSVGSGDLVQYTRFRQLIQLPLSASNSANNVAPQIEPGTAIIYDSNDTPIMKDINGAGIIESLDGFFYPDVLIDYNKNLMELPTVPNGEYYVEYQQGSFMNFTVAQDGYVGISPIRTYEELGSPDVYFSSIVLL